MNERLYSYRDGHVDAWRPTTLRALGKTERALEDLIAATPELLGLEPHRTGIRGPFVVFRRVHLETPQGRELVPDLVLLSQSGHALIVEARLGDSEELRDRRAIAELLEYAASFSHTSEEALLALFGGERRATSWGELVRALFPQEEQPAALAAALLRRLTHGELHLFLACDGAPDGLRELIGSVTSKHTLGGYELKVAVLTPHASSRGASEGLLLVPETPLRTEIIARTAVTISYEQGQPRPAVAVATTPPEQIVEHLGGARPPREYYGAVLRAYEQRADELAQRLRLPGLQLRGGAPTFRQIRPEGWPGGIHYELLDRAQHIGVELHLESAEVLRVQSFLKQLPARLFHRLPTMEWSDHWSKGKGKLSLRSPVDRKPEEAARLMLSFIEHSALLIDRELRALGVC